MPLVVVGHLLHVVKRPTVVTGVRDRLPLQQATGVTWISKKMGGNWPPFSPFAPVAGRFSFGANVLMAVWDDEKSFNQGRHQSSNLLSLCCGRCGLCASLAGGKKKDEPIELCSFGGIKWRPSSQNIRVCNDRVECFSFLWPCPRHFRYFELRPEEVEIWSLTLPIIKNLTFVFVWQMMST